MFWGAASCVLLILVAAAALFVVRRRCQEALACNRELQSKLGELKALLAAADEITARLEAAMERAEASHSAPRSDALAAIESLGDSAALADATALAEVAAQFPGQATDPIADIFEQDAKALSVARLCGQGLKPAEISRRLSLPIGEVEFLLSLRPSSQA